MKTKVTYNGLKTYANFEYNATIEYDLEAIIQSMALRGIKSKKKTASALKGLIRVKYSQLR